MQTLVAGATRSDGAALRVDAVVADDWARRAQRTPATLLRHLRLAVPRQPRQHGHHDYLGLGSVHQPGGEQARLYLHHVHV